jgi:crotonobetainyl-CoA:carnitine CoA-transferase CaiB-like acyl-CoA transferase
MAPSIGQDTAEILASLGVEPSELQRLSQEGIVRIGAEKSK